MMKNISLVSLCDLSNDDKLLILEWRNHINVRVWMYNDKCITMENHFKFISTLNGNTEKKYFLVYEKNIKVGVIYFTNIDLSNKTAEFGLYANPNLKGKGAILMETIIDKAFYKLKVTKLFAEVFGDNKKAIMLYRQYNFIEYKKSYINHREIIYMELKNETR